MTEARWGRFTRGLAELEGWTARLRADFGPAPAELVLAHRLVETEIERPDDLPAALASVGENGYEVALLGSDDDGFDVKVVEKASSAAQTVRVPVELLASPVYANVRRAYARLAELVGPPPFTLGAGKKARSAETFVDLRHELLEVAKDGIQITRFKGLGEMNDDQLWETTMDPARRLLIRVDVEDASAADQVFSILMGDQVEPRREFIEQNAKDVRFLDV
jgi:DNA gyrase subunit B